MSMTKGRFKEPLESMQFGANAASGSGAAYGVGSSEPANDVVVFGIGFWNPTYREFKEWWQSTLDSEERLGKRVICANAYTLNNAWTSPDFMRAIQSAEAKINDGIGFRVASSLRGVRVAYNFNGTDLVPRLCSEAVSNLRIFLYGASEEANALAAAELDRAYSKVEVVGRINGYVDAETEAVPAIAASDADLVLVALGHPKQELFAERFQRELNAKIIFPVGGLFDFLSGCKPRAPRIVRQASLEWAYRLALEPRRMFARYVIGNPLFIARSLASAGSDRRKMTERSSSA
jgi:N-acetylglucosaminyldiphosphoundecaprenol N-acetyl-beta-D-mannosaminyltransferase